jgi:glyoxylase-like metal-dependent hydrolase (beta-lactamase superfamily II)/8-oxo-dGTP pyrophosphatase MutT (NUDIX family)
LFMVRRVPKLRFFGGFWAFPGGKVDNSDGDPASSPADRQLHAAARELFEECGVLIAREPNGAFPILNDGLVNKRRGLIEGRFTFGEVLNDLNLRLSSKDFLPVGNLVTPPFSSQRFDSSFYLVPMPGGQKAEVWPGELDEGKWIPPGVIIDDWNKGRSLIAPPTLALLQTLRNRPVPEWAGRLSALMDDWMGKPLPPIFFAPQVQLLPLRTQALQPSTHTNSYLVGHDPAYLLDPGPTDPVEQEKLFGALDVQQALGRRLAAVVLTHHHPDHVGAARAVSQRYSLPICAHPLTARLLKGKVEINHEIQDVDRLDLGTAPDGSGPLFLQAMHTPGHAPGHLAFYESHYRLLFAGDLVSPQTSMIIAPPDGDLSVYLDSLKKAKALDCGLLLPAHGSPTAQPARLIQEALELRAKREQQILDALCHGPRSESDLLDEVYRGVPTALSRYAALQLQAGLIKLEREAKAERVRDAADPLWGLCQANKTS